MLLIEQIRLLSRLANEKERTDGNKEKANIISIIMYNEKGNFSTIFMVTIKV